VIAFLLVLLLTPPPAQGYDRVEWNRLLQRLPACDTDTIFRGDFDPLPWLGF
jgi:hypothetical protein